MKRIILIILTASIAVSWLACDVTAESYKGEPNVYGIVSTDSSTVTVMVGRTISILDTIEVDTVYDTFWYGDVPVFVDTVAKYPWNGTSGAELTLSSGDERYNLTEDEDSSGYYRIDSMEFEANQSWSIEISYPQGEMITANTTLVDEFTLAAPERDTLYEGDSVKWERAQGVEAYLICTMQPTASHVGLRLV
ncbi:DUF4249 family protein [candidate division WOR-3 bacterium]|nr:DUF4249 family protein [candidate division WOR-3 bacterium]